MSAPNLAIFYHPDGYDPKGRPLMGRRAAGKSFLDAWFDRRGADETYCLAAREPEFRQFVEHARSRGASGKVHWLKLERPENTAQAGTLYFPGPDIAINAWRRFRRDPLGYSIMGITHTICTKAVMDGIAEWLTAPVEPWDAVICTSLAVRQSVEYEISAQREHLARRMNATKFTTPQLPVIPLGINTKEFAPDAALRAQTRQKLGIADAETAFLFVGRLSIFGKAHPVPMFIALERAARESGRTCHLILAGWFPNKSLERAFASAAKHWCPSVTIHAVDGRDDAARNGAWRAGDVFVSLVDNVQETFGLTPVEAMAAGLPAVVSDWDGYRDTVRHGADGFRIPTLLAPPAFGELPVDRYAADIDNYDHYLARTTYNAVVDIGAAAQAFMRLIHDPDLRKRMGEAGRARATSEYDWQHVLGKYEELAGELGAIRKAAAAPDPKQRRVWPARLSPFEMFANYPTRSPASTDRARLAASDIEPALAGIRADSNASIDDTETLIAGLRELAGMLAIREHTIGELIEAPGLPGRMQRLAWLLRLAKFGVISIEPANGAAAPKLSPADGGSLQAGK